MGWGLGLRGGKGLGHGGDSDITQKYSLGYFMIIYVN